jgi:5-methyltetrahydrofolate--homocysteine methyltransferase
MAPQVRVLIGGAAVTPAFARRIGADAYGKDALDAIRKIEALAGRKK